MKSPIKYYGGKSYMTDIIIDQFPKDYEVYVESYNWDFDCNDNYPVNGVRDGYIHEKSGVVKYVTYIS